MLLSFLPQGFHTCCNPCQDHFLLLVIWLIPSQPSCVKLNHFPKTFVIHLIPPPTTPDSLPLLMCIPLHTYLCGLDRAVPALHVLSSTRHTAKHLLVGPVLPVTSHAPLHVLGQKCLSTFEGLLPISTTLSGTKIKKPHTLISPTFPLSSSPLLQSICLK